MRSPLLSPPAPDVHSYALGEELVLFAESTRQLCRLNGTAALIWFSLVDGLGRDAIAEELAAAYGIERDIAQRDVGVAIAQWRALGLLRNGTVGSLNKARPRRQQASDGASKEEAGKTATPSNVLPPANGHTMPEALGITSEYAIRACARRSPKRWAAHHCYRLLDTCFQVRFANRALENWIHPVLAHLETADAGPAVRRITVTDEGTGYAVYYEGLPVARCSALDEIAPLVNAEILVTAYSATDCLTAVHAAVVSDGARGILLPATSGSGKSTLAAALVASGLQYLSDEVALITRGTHSVRPVPVSLSTKIGAWPVLIPLYPSLPDLPVHRRQDGRTVRYLPPPPTALPKDLSTALPIACVVFPRYQAQAPTRLAALSPADGLCRIAEAGYDVNGGLTAARVAELVTWLRNIPCYQLTVGHLNDAIGELKGLVG